jgi:hypothetical protein
MPGQLQPTETEGRGAAPDRPDPECDRANDGVPTCATGPVGRIRWAAGELADIARGWRARRDADRMVRAQPPLRPTMRAMTFDPGSKSRDEVIL